MRRKITVLLVTTIIIALFFTVLIGCGKKAEEKAPAKVEKTEEQVPAKTTEQEEQPARALTDDDFIEYWAFQKYITEHLAEKYKNDPLKYSAVIAEEQKKFSKKFGLTWEQLGEKFAAWMAEWQKKAISDPEKASKQWEEMEKRMEKRLEELKKGE